MSRMRTSRGLQGLVLATILLVFGWTACSRRAGLEPGGTTTPAHQQQVPFHQEAGTGPEDSGTGDDSARFRRPKNESDVPFKAPNSAILTAGTLLTVRLEAPISTAKPGVSKTFAAILEEPVTVDGTTVLPRGAMARGRLECSHATLKPGTGYVCLTLESIAVAGKVVPFETSNLFAKGVVKAWPAPAGSNPAAEHGRAAVRIEKGRRLTFRLRHSVVLNTGQQDAADSFRSGSK